MPRGPTKLTSPPPPEGGWPPAPDARRLAELTAFALRMWRVRADEIGAERPGDLSGSCRFTTLLVQSLHGGEIRGSHDHFHVRLTDRTIVDLNAGARDVAELRSRGLDPLLHHRAFMGSTDVRSSFNTCRPRVADWLRAWNARS